MQWIWIHDTGSCQIKLHTPSPTHRIRPISMIKLFTVFTLVAETTSKYKSVLHLLYCRLVAEQITVLVAARFLFFSSALLVSVHLQH